jgi:glucokinase
MATILAGDIGGTKIRLGLYETAAGELELLGDRTYATRDSPSLEAAIRDFLGGQKRVLTACCGVPGLVLEGVSRPVNIPWEIRAESLSALLHGASVRLLNDLEATAWGTLHLKETETAILQPGRPRREPANMAVIAAGTGLGEAGLIRVRDGWHVVASEGGHADFAPRGEEEEQLLRFLAREFDHVSFERVVSGPGLHNIYRFVAAQAAAPEPEWLKERLRCDDPSAVIGEVGIAGTEPNCVRSLALFTAVYGAEAANLALKYLALGGVFVCGGIAPKILPALRDGAFIRAFVAKGRLRSTVEQIPVRVSMNPDLGLVGAAHVAASML